MTRVLINVLGPIEVEVDGIASPIGGMVQQRILATLCLQPGSIVPTDRLVEAAWPVEPPSEARRVFRTYMSRLRRALNEAGATSVVLTVEGGYALAPGVDVDAQRLVSLIGEARRAEGTEAAAACLEDALGLWRGEPFGPVGSDPTVQPEAVRLEELRASAAEEMFEAWVHGDRARQVVAEIGTWMEKHPFSEALCSLQMRALAAAGRPTEALRAFQTFRAQLVEQVGLEPSATLSMLEHEILTGGEAESHAVPMGVPSGVVTFLFTDVERSTEMCEEQPGQMGEALRLHDELVRASVAEFGGYVFATGGDGFAVTFARADMAVTAAARIQEALAAATWPDRAALRVRMALHTGEAEERRGDYFGPAVNRTARLMSLAAGGQVLLSGTTVDVLLDGDSVVELVDLGRHRLRDLTRPEQIFQLGSAEHPPLPTTEMPPTNLAAEASSLIGREADLAALAELLDSERLITLIGVGGVGKTRLAMRVAREKLASGEFRGGVWAVEFGQTNREDAILAQIVASLGLRIDERPATSTLVDFLRSRDALVVLDNCEHLIGAIAVLVADLIAGCPGLRVLATSREPLMAPGERLVPIGSLRSDDGVRLLADRVGAEVDTWDGEQHPLAEQLSERLDHIPLALELAAGRVRALGIAEVASHLDDRFRLLVGSTRGRVERHKTLRAALDWSYELLSPSEQDAFAALALFPGPFDTAAAAAVVAGNDELAALESVASLVDKSMVERITTPRGATRYRLLETMRAYGAQQLDALGTSEHVRGLMASHYVKKYLDLRRHRFVEHELEVQDGLLEDVANLRASVGWLIDQGSLDDAMELLCELGYMSTDAGWWEPLQWIDDLLATGAIDDHPRRPEALSWSAMRALLHLGDIDRARSLAEESVALVTDDRQTLRTVWTLGCADLIEGNLQDSVERFDHALRRARDLDEVFHHYQSLFMKSQPLAWLGRFDDAAAVADEMMSEARRCGSPSMRGFAHLARASSLMNQPAAAAAEFRAALDIGRNGPHHSLVMMTWPGLIETEASRRPDDETAAELRDFFTWHLDQGLAQPMHLLTPFRTTAILAARTHQAEAAAQLNAGPFARAGPGEAIDAIDHLAEAEAELGDRLEAVQAEATQMGLDELVHVALDVCNRVLAASGRLAEVR